MGHYEVSTKDFPINFSSILNWLCKCFEKRANDLLRLKKKKITINSLSEDQVTTITSLSGVQEFPMRVKCATMAWHTLMSAIETK